MTQMAIPCLVMRGGTSKGPYFNAADLPKDVAERDRVLLAALGSPDPRQIDGLGGAVTVTSKVAIVSPSERDGVDVNYLFAQVDIDKPIVDTDPSCGNMLAGVGPAAIEMGMIKAADGETRIVIYNENTESRIEAVIQTPGGRVRYDGDAMIDGVPGTAAPVIMNFMDVVGSKTGAFFPTGHVVEDIQGIQVSCVDVAMPMIHMRAADFGLSGHESQGEIEAILPSLIARLEPIRREAGERMGFGDVADKVVPKVGLLAAPAKGGDICSRYFTPLSLHATHALTGAICTASAAAVKGTIAHGLVAASDANPRDFVIEHPSGEIGVRLKTTGSGADMDVVAGTLRTARLIMRGEVMVPA